MATRKVCPEKLQAIDIICCELDILVTNTSFVSTQALGRINKNKHYKVRPVLRVKGLE